MIFNLKTNVTQAKNYNSKKKGKNKFRGLKKIPKRRGFFWSSLSFITQSNNNK